MVWNPKADYSSPQSQFIKWELVPYTRGKGLDVGCGAIKPFPHFLGVDTKEFTAGGLNIKPDVMMDATNLSIFASQSMDFVLSSHVLQESEDYKKILQEMWRVLKPRGFLIVYLPDKNLKKQDKLEGVTLPHEWSKEDFIEVMKTLPGWNLVRNEERSEGNEYSFFQVYFKLKSDKHLFSWQEPKPEKTACVVRYGAFGDLMQCSPIFAQLKAQGYHVTVHSSPPGLDVIRHDPNIDHLQIQDKDQVPNGELGEYWEFCKKKYDKFINLSSSVEAALLAEHDGYKAHWTQSARHLVLNKNYMELQHSIAGLEKTHPVKFFPTEEERIWAKKERLKMPEFVIMWSLAGSSVHKTWPYLDTVIARALLRSDRVGFVLVGGPESEILEAGWEKEKRVVRTCGKWNIRQSLAFIYEADLIVGPETGVLNAACDMDVPKIIFLSHSSVENLTRDWKNTVSLFSKTTSCHPCHILHKDWKLCRKDQTNGVAECQSAISADEVWEPMERIISNALVGTRLKVA